MKRKKMRFMTMLLFGCLLLGSAGLPVRAEENTIIPIEEVNVAEAASAQAALLQLTGNKVIVATVYLTDAYAVRNLPGQNGEIIATLPSGAQTFIQGVEFSEGMAWYQVAFYVDEVEKTGYIEAENLVSSDTDFLAWQNSYLAPLSDTIAESLVRAGNEDILAFPNSYRAALTQLKSQHPNWTFVPMNTGVDWSTVVYQESINNRSWVYRTKSDAWKAGAASQSGWYIASQAAVEYCLDPRNFINETNVFMFEQLTYNAGYHSVNAVQSIIQNSFMRGEVSGEGISYAQAFYNIGSSLGVSPFHLACRVYQEQGANGTSPLISGTYPGYEGYYNYFNVGASGGSNEQIYVSGLTTAKNRGWNSRMKSLSGGASFISANYILRGQDTLYLQKFDVDSSYNGMFSHQYQQNITAPITEGATIKQAYNQTGALNNPFVFKIPVYNNMPTKACPDPDNADQEKENEQLQAFVVRLYETALARTNYDQTEVDFWYNALRNKEKTGAEVAQGFFFSEEFRNRNLSNSDFVDTLYAVMFNRTADAGGKENWLSKLENGMSRDYVYMGFANATEFELVCNSYGVNRGTITLGAYRDQNEGVTSFVNRLYSKLLGRAGDDGGMEDWCRKILRREDSTENIAYGFVFSAEFMNKNTNNEEFVKLMYRTFLDREYDAAGLSDWVRQLEQGRTREEVFRGFARSQEFQNLMQQYGVV